MTNEPIITVLGPTATGKTGVAVRIAAELGGEIVSADSRQVFRRMDIGSGKDLSEYQYNGNPIPYHLIDVEEPGREYNVYRYQQEAFKAIRDIQERGKRVVFCGGSGLYIDAVLQGYRFQWQEESQILSDPVPSAIIGLRGDVRTDVRIVVQHVRNVIPSALLTVGAEGDFVHVRYHVRQIAGSHVQSQLLLPFAGRANCDNHIDAQVINGPLVNQVGEFVSRTGRGIEHGQVHHLILGSRGHGRY